MHRLGRRDFLLAVAAVTGAARHLLFGMSLSQPTGNRAAARAVVSRPVKFPAPGVTVVGYLARPAGDSLYPAVIFIGDGTLDETVRERAREHASRGYVALAIDPLSRSGGSTNLSRPQPGQRTHISSKAKGGTQINADLDAAFNYLRSNPFVAAGRIEVVRP